MNIINYTFYLDPFYYSTSGQKLGFSKRTHNTKKPVTTMLTNPWKCTVLHCNHLETTGADDLTL